MSWPDVVIIDLDGTLADTRHRDHLAVAGEWEEFHSLCYMDKPNWDVVHLLKMIPDEDTCLIITGRNEKWRQPTLDWLEKFDLSQYVDEVLMRPDNDFSKAPELKIRLLCEWLEKDAYNLIDPRTLAGLRIKFALDDREKVIDAFRAFGIHCWQPRAGVY